MQWRPNVATPLPPPQANFQLHKLPVHTRGLGVGRLLLFLPTRAAAVRLRASSPAQSELVHCAAHPLG